MRILVPVDFSHVSANAFKYALQLASGNELVIVHVTSQVESLGDKPSTSSMETFESQLIKSLKSYLLKRLRKEDWPNNVSITILSGEPVQEINKFTENNAFDYVVIGTRDNFSLVDRWIGTVSLGLVKTLKMPVYLIPKQSTFNRFDKIVVASDAQLIHEGIIDSIKSWNEPYQAYVKFLHVQENLGDDYEKESMTIIRSLFEKSDPKFGFEIVNMKGQHVKTTLLASAYNFKADLLIAIASHQSFIESLLFSSMSKELIEEARIPLLFFHIN